MKSKVFLTMVLALFALSMMSVIYAVPSGPEGPIVPIKSERWAIWAPQTAEALAGNVTEFNTNASSITRTWQGYFGNITGVIVLGDASNNTLYDWNLANPQGEIYAVRSANVPSWSDVRCSSDAELQAEDTALGVNASIDEDAVNNTFAINGSSDQRTRYPTADLTHPLFYVANVTIDGGTCPVASMYNSSRDPSPYFKEVLLSDNALVPIIYTALIAHTINPFAESDGFDDRTHDFEMIVGENGHLTDSNPSTYWFYLELE